MKDHSISVLLLAALVVVNVGCGNKKKKEGDPLYTAPLGIQAYTYRHSFPVDVAATLDTIQKMGFTEMVR